MAVELKISTMRRFAVMLFFLSPLVGCIGTDLIDETPSLRLEHDEIALEVGTSATLSAELLVRAGTETMVLGKAVMSWTSADPATATVDDEGVVTARSVGQTVMTGTYAGTEPAVVDSPRPLVATVTVVADRDSVARVSVELPAGTASTLMIGDSFSLQVEIRNLDDEPVVADELSYTNSAPSVLSVDSSGVVTALSVGSVEVRATADGVTSSALPLIVSEEGSTGVSRSGQLQGVSGYSATGTVSLVSNRAGVLELVFSDDFASSSGPDLDVLLSPGETVSPASLNLGDLKSLSGGQNYAVPSGVTLDEFSHVIIHCVAFNVLFARAELGETM